MIKSCRKSDIDPDRPKSEQKWCLYSKTTGKLLGRHPTKEHAMKQERLIQMKKHSHVKLSHLFSQNEIDLVKSLIQKALENADAKSETEYSKPDVPDSTVEEVEEVKPLHLEQQTAIIQYAPKEKLWLILEHDNAWLELLQNALPKDYLEHFTKRMSDLAIHDKNTLEKMAEMYVRHKVSKEHLAAAIVQHWAPQDLLEATKFLNDNDFLERPLMPINLRA